MKINKQEKYHMSIITFSMQSETSAPAKSEIIHLLLQQFSCIFHIIILMKHCRNKICVVLVTTDIFAGKNYTHKRWNC